MVKRDVGRVLVTGALAVALWIPVGCSTATPPGQASPTTSSPAARAATASSAATDPALRKEIQARYDLMEAAWQKRDAQGVVDLLDESYVYTPSLADQKPMDKKATEAATKSFMKSMPRNVELTSLVTVKDVAMQGDQAVAHTETSRKMVSLRRKTGQSRTIETVTTATDTWKKTAQGWKLAANTQETIAFRVDGKALPRPAPRPGTTMSPGTYTRPGKAASTGSPAGEDSPSPLPPATAASPSPPL